MGDAELVGDLRAGVPERDQPDDLALARGERPSARRAQSGARRKRAPQRDVCSATNSTSRRPSTTSVVAAHWTATRLPSAWRSSPRRVKPPGRQPGRAIRASLASGPPTTISAHRRRPQPRGAAADEADHGRVDVDDPALLVDAAPSRCATAGTRSRTARASRWRATSRAMLRAPGPVRHPPKRMMRVHGDGVRLAGMPSARRDRPAPVVGRPLRPAPAAEGQPVVRARWCARWPGRCWPSWRSLIDGTVDLAGRLDATRRRPRARC